MDALSHALIGIAVGGLSGHPISVHEPVYIAAVLGALAPDFDIIARINGSLAYLKHHRAFSHSLPGSAMWASLIALSVSCFYPQTGFSALWLWALAGSLSHIFIDYLNTHGAALLWPFRRERKSCHLLNVFDPLLLALILGFHTLKLPVRHLSILSFTVLFLYIITRAGLRAYAAGRLRKHFSGSDIKRIMIMPSLRRICIWDYVAETDMHYHVGRLSLTGSKAEIHRTMSKRTVTKAASEAQKTFLGEFFSTFTPLVYIEEVVEENTARVNFYDLRYYLNCGFIHSATVLLDKDMAPRASYLNSYGEKINIPC